MHKELTKEIWYWGIHFIKRKEIGWVSARRSIPKSISPLGGIREDLLETLLGTHLLLELTQDFGFQIFNP